MEVGMDRINITLTAAHGMYLTRISNLEELHIPDCLDVLEAACTCS
jgi:hypothetical protein